MNSTLIYSIDFFFNVHIDFLNNLKVFHKVRKVRFFKPIYHVILIDSKTNIIATTIYLWN